MVAVTYNAHPDDQPPAEWRRFGSRREVDAALPEASLQDPVPVGVMVLKALASHVEYATALRRLVTPESIPSWGDFRERAEFLNSLPDMGWSSIAERAYGDGGVAYLKVFSGVPESFQILGDQLLVPAAVVTLVWRQELGEWRVHWIGDYVKPEDVPH